MLHRILIYDTETTIFKHQKVERKASDKVGSAFSNPQKLVMSGFKWLNDDSSCFGNNGIAKITQEFFNESTCIVMFNGKFDLHWARRIGVDISKVCIWDCQIAEFLLNKQKPRMPSLNQACEKYGLPLKIDVIKNDYWDKGIDTDEIPTEILQEYLEGDLVRTEAVFKHQLKQFKGIEL